MYIDTVTSSVSSFFFNDPETKDIYTLSLHDALPILNASNLFLSLILHLGNLFLIVQLQRSEERFSRNAETDLVCRLLLEKKTEALTSRPSKTRHSMTPPLLTYGASNTLANAVAVAFF